MNNKIKHIYDPVHGRIPYNKLENIVLSTKFFNRLHHITQNSTAFFTFPSAKHTRYLHSIGTMHVASLMLRSAFLNSKSTTIEGLLKSFKEKVSEKIEASKKDYIAYSQQNGQSQRQATIQQLKITNIMAIITDYCSVCDFDIRIEDESLYAYYVLLLQILRMSGLLHDVGHPPFSHIAEWSLERYYERPEKLGQEFRKAYEEITNKNADKLHEQLGKKITKNNFSLFGCLLEQDDSFNDEEKIAIHLVGSLVLDIFNNTNEENGFNYATIHDLVDGMVDADRIDYILRDSFFSGYGYASFDRNRIISNFQITKEKDKYLILPKRKIVKNIEDFLYARNELYINVIFNHEVAKTNMILNDTLVGMLIMSSSVDSVDSVDSVVAFKIKPNILGLWEPLKEQSASVRNHIFSQYDENWLTFILKETYFDLLGHMKDINTLEFIDIDRYKDITDWKVPATKHFLGLEEVLFGKNHFKSQFKDNIQFDSIFNTNNKKRAVLILQLKQVHDELRALIRAEQKKDFLVFFTINPQNIGYNPEYKILDDNKVKLFAEVSNIEQTLNSTSVSNVPPFYLFIYSKEEKETLVFLRKVIEMVKTILEEVEDV